MREFEVLLKLKQGIQVKRVRTYDAYDAVCFAESLVPGSTARGVVELNSWVNA